MIRLFSLSLLFTAASWTAASACSPEAFYDFETGRTYAYFRPPTYDPPKQILDDNTSVVVLRTELIKQSDAKYGDHRENLLRHIVEETLTAGSMPLADRAYTHDPKLKETHLEPGFEVWDDGIINTPKSAVGLQRAPCGELVTQLTLKPDSLYLALIRSGPDGDPVVKDAFPLTSLNDPIVVAYRKVVAEAPDAPNRMSAESYFKNMFAFIELEILECADWEDFQYEDSPFAAREKQIDVLYRLGERTHEPTHPFDVREPYSYLNNMRKGPNHRKIGEPKKCRSGDRFLYIGGHGDRYLMVENGLVDVSKIGTRITITGPQKVRAVDVKRWIRKANEK